MSPAVAYALPAVHLMCHLVAYNTTDSAANHLMQQQSWPLPDDYVAYPDIQTAYKIHYESVSWIDARYLCTHENAQLALIDTPKKFEYVMRQRKSPGLTHVGIIRMYDDEMWVGVSTGFPVSSLPWATGEPFGDQDCVMMSGDGSGLVNHSCDVKSNYVCELPIFYENTKLVAN